MMPQLKPDTLNGQTIFRGVDTGPDGVNHVNKLIVFPPSIKVGPVPVLPLEELVDEFMKRLVMISPDHRVQAQLEMFKTSLRPGLLNFAKRVEAQSRG